MFTLRTIYRPKVYQGKFFLIFKCENTPFMFQCRESLNVTVYNCTQMRNVEPETDFSDRRNVIADSRSKATGAKNTIRMSLTIVR